MGLCASVPSDVSSPAPITHDIKRKQSGEKLDTVALTQKKKMKKLQIVGAQLPSDYQVKTYPKKEADTKKID